MLGWFKDKDMFGHVVNINFDKQGPTHKTEIGGVVSVFIKVVIYVYIIFKFKILLARNSASLQTACSRMSGFIILAYEKNQSTVENALF